MKNQTGKASSVKADTALKPPVNLRKSGSLVVGVRETANIWPFWGAHA
eukprot:SAG31_NODE_7522_length_1666_cov_1.345246_1_plen_47_part_10